MFKDPEQLEFAISQYVDGTLSASEVAEVEAILRTDAAAAELLREFRAIDAAIKSPASSPGVNWDSLTSSISAQIEDELNVPESLPMPWVRARKMLIAASVIIAAGIAFKLTTPTQPSPGNIGTDVKTKPTAVAMIKGPVAEKASAAAVADVKIGPSATLAKAPYQYHAAEAILMQPSQVIIESDAPADRPAGLFQ